MVIHTLSRQNRLIEMIRVLYSTDVREQLQIARMFRKMSTIARNIEKIVRTGVVPRFVQLLKVEGNPKLQYEAAWVLTNIASGTSAQTKVVVNAEAVPILINLLNSKYKNVREQALWALGNIAGDGQEYRDLVLGEGIITSLIQLLKKSEKTSILRKIAWLLSNLCRGVMTSESYQKVLPNLPAFSGLLYHTDYEVLSKTCWALSYLCDGPCEAIKAVIDAGVCEQLVKLLMHDIQIVVIPAIRAVGNIATGDDIQTQVIIDYEALPNLLRLLSNYNEKIRKEVCWTISNIAAGNTHQIQAIIDVGIFPVLMNMLRKDDLAIQKEIAWVIKNATINGTSEQIKYLVENRCAQGICSLLNTSDSEVIKLGLESLENILRFGENDAEKCDGRNGYKSVIEQSGGLSKIESLQQHEDTEVFWKAIEIMKYYPSAKGKTENKSGDCVVNTSRRFKIPSKNFFATFAAIFLVTTILIHQNL